MGLASKLMGLASCLSLEIYTQNKHLDIETDVKTH